MFHLCFRMYVASVFYLDVAYFSYICCKCFIWILRMFCNGFKCFSRCLFANISKACFKYLSAFRRMLQLLHLNILKIHQVLCLSHRFPIASPRCLLLLRVQAEHLPPPTPLPDAGDVGGGTGNLHRKRMGRAHAVPARHACAESEGVWAGSGMGLGCPDWEARKQAWAPTCARTRENGAAGIDIWALVRPFSAGRIFII
jgi:hypothetical protein